MSDVLTRGQCLCGSVSYSVSGAPARMAQCHCKDCQRATGTGHASIAFFMEEQVDISGETTRHDTTADSGNTNSRYFCPTCGCRMFTTNSGRAGVMGVLAGSADDNDWFEPGAVVYCKDRPAWDITTSEIPNFDAMPPPPK